MKIKGVKKSAHMEIKGAKKSSDPSDVATRGARLIITNKAEVSIKSGLFVES
jgi:hypothetical protein